MTPSRCAMSAIGAAAAGGAPARASTALTPGIRAGVTASAPAPGALTATGVAGRQGKRRASALRFFVARASLSPRETLDRDADTMLVWRVLKQAVDDRCTSCRQWPGAECCKFGTTGKSNFCFAESRQAPN